MGACDHWLSLNKELKVKKQNEWTELSLTNSINGYNIYIEIKMSETD